MGWWPDTEDHILSNVYMEKVKFHTLSIISIIVKITWPLVHTV
jgi:hypothetical protein